MGKRREGGSGWGEGEGGEEKEGVDEGCTTVVCSNQDRGHERQS